MDNLADMIIECNFNNIKYQKFPHNKRIGLIIYENDVKYEFLINLKGSDKLLVCGSGGLVRDSGRDRSKPYFERWSWDFKVSTIFYNDPTLYIDDNLLCGWGIGTSDNWYLETISKIIVEIADNINISYNRIIFFGACASGFMSIMLSIMIKGSIAIADIPQCAIYKHGWQWEEIKKYCFKNLDENLIHENFEYRLNVIEFMNLEMYIPKIFIICDSTCEHDFKNNMIPFFEETSILPFENNNNYINFIIKVKIEVMPLWKRILKFDLLI